MIVQLESQIKPFILLILAVCLISLNIIFAKTNESIGSKREVMSFRGMLVSFMIYALVDIRLLIGDGFYTMFPRPIVHFIVAVGFGVMSLACYFWFLHVSSNIHPKIKNKKVKTLRLWDIFALIPMAIVVLLLFTPLHVFVYEIVDGMVVFYPMLSFILFLDYVYLIIATVISIRNMRRAKNRLEKKKYRSQILFIVFFTISGILIGFLINLPAIELCVIPVVIKLFVELQDSQIYTDALTKLNNRRRLKEYIHNELQSCSEDNPLTVIMVDLDYFKSINDILGHDEGDRALIAFSHALKDTFKGNNAVIARWGGDEFIVAGKDKNLATDLRERLEDSLKKKSGLDYPVSFSLGIFNCVSPDMTGEQILVEADALLYKDKEVQHKKGIDYNEQLKAVKNKK